MHIHSEPSLRTVLLPVLLLWLGSAALAQQQFAELHKRTLPGDPGPITASGDVDGDGDVDLVIGRQGQNELWRNRGDGTFVDDTVASLPMVSDDTLAVALGDLDGDGDLDLVCGNGYSGILTLGQHDAVYLNDGTGIFVAAGTALPGYASWTLTLALGDVDGDGDLDLVTGGSDNTLSARTRLYLNDGAARFTEVTGARLPAQSAITTCVGLVDLDGDGDLDLLLGGRDGFGRDRIYLNDGSGNFTDSTATHLPGQATHAADFAAGDLDGDGDVDLVLADTARGDLLYLNDGTGVLNAAPPGQLVPGASTGLDLGDVDGDGDLDLLRDASLHLNDGAGTFRDVTPLRVPSGSAGPGRFSDFDGDGTLDIVLPRRVLLATARGAYFDVAGRRMPDVGGNAHVFADVDGDGYPDLLVARDGQNQLLLNDAAGAFLDATSARMPADDDGTAAIAVGDLDGDGDVDLVCANRGLRGSGESNRIYRNIGGGHFVDVTSTSLPAQSAFSTDLALGDVDRDGDLDLFVAGSWQSHLYLNDGTGTFVDVTATNVPARSASSVSIAMGDVDGDGDLDVFLGNAGSAISRIAHCMYLNDGTGVFVDVTASSLPVDPQGARDNADAAFGDVDGDGDLDLLLGNPGRLVTGFGQWAEARNQLLVNDGNGVFTDVTSTRMPPPARSTRGLALADVDVDGDLDIVVAVTGDAGPTPGLGENRIYLNDGAGSFVDAGNALLPADLDYSVAVAVADVDLDGDPDIVFSGARRVRLFLNLRRQLFAPGLLRPGQRQTYEVYARGGPQRLLHVAFSYVSLGEASIPVPGLGILRVDPAMSAALDPVLIPPGGVARTSFLVPADRSLVGVRSFAQALVVGLGFEAGLTGLVRETVR